VTYSQSVRKEPRAGRTARIGLGGPELVGERLKAVRGRLADYLEVAGHGGEMAGALFRPVTNNVGGSMEEAMTADGIYRMVRHYVPRVSCVVRVLVWFAIAATASMRSTTGGTFLFLFSK
jgi:hypothetical protein